MADASEEKRTLRKYYAELRASLKTPMRDGAIAQNTLNALCGGSFFIYCAFRTEADTEYLIRTLLTQGKRVCVPRIEDGRMIAVPFSDKLERNAYGILQPCGGEDTPCETVLTPLLAVDGEGYRLGYGGGYYDRYFASHPLARRIGLCYAGQVCKALPHESTDIPLHAIVTEEGTRFYGV